MRTRVIIPAAGKGTRMRASLPGRIREETAKALCEVSGRPMIVTLLETILEARVDPKPVVVVSEETGAEVRAVLGESCEYAVQQERLGTAHAVACAEPILRGRADTVMVFYADMPFVAASTIRSIWEAHVRALPVITMGTVTVPDFEDWRHCLSTYGRVVRSHEGIVQKIVEMKDAAPAELEIKEVSPSFFCFDAEWLWETLPRIGQGNAQGERYLPDLVGIAIERGRPVETVDVPPIDAIGINTFDELTLAQGLDERRAEGGSE